MKSTTLLSEVKEQTQTIQRLAEQYFLPLSSAQLNYKPSPEKWSIAECLEHLNYYSSYYNNAIQAAIQKAGQKGWTATSVFSPTWLGKKSVAMVQDEQKPIKAKNFLNPALSQVDPDVVQRFIKGQIEFLRLIHAAQKVNLNKAKVRIEIMKLFKLPLGDIFLFMVAHHQRHCNQAMRIHQQLTNVEHS